MRPARGPAADPGLPDDRDQRLLTHLPGPEQGREVAALPELGGARPRRAEPGVEGALAEAVAAGEPLRRALVAPGPDQALHGGLRPRPQPRPGDGARDRPAPESGGSGSERHAAARAAIPSMPGRAPAGVRQPRA